MDREFGRFGRHRAQPLKRLAQSLRPGLVFALGDAVCDFDELTRVTPAGFDSGHEICQPVRLVLDVLADLNGYVELAVDDVGGTGVLARFTQLVAGSLGMASGKCALNLLPGAFDAAADVVEDVDLVGDAAWGTAANRSWVMFSSWRTVLPMSRISAMGWWLAGRPGDFACIWELLSVEGVPDSGHAGFFNYTAIPQISHTFHNALITQCILQFRASLAG